MATKRLYDFNSKTLRTTNGSYDDDGNYTKGVVEVNCCGEWFECFGFTTTCFDCGSDYNWNGSLLAPRESWGEETGEHYSDIVNADHGDW